MRFGIIAAAAAGLMTVGAGPAMAASAISNGGFETGTLSPWYQARDFGGTGNWAVTNTRSHSGAYSAFDDGNKEIRQDFAAIAVSDITELSFWLLHEQSAPAAYALFYSDGTIFQSAVLTTTLNWERSDVTSKLTAGKFLTGFSVFGYSGGVTYLDDVTITTSAAPVPEPAAWAMMILGIGAIGATVRRKRTVAVA